MNACWLLSLSLHSPAVNGLVPPSSSVHVRKGYLNEKWTASYTERHPASRKSDIEEIHFWVCGAILTIYAKLLHLYSPPLQRFHCAVLSGPQYRHAIFFFLNSEIIFFILNFFPFFFSKAQFNVICILSVTSFQKHHCSRLLRWDTISP